MYDLAVQGFLGFARFGRNLQQMAVARDPLSGVIDGTNRTFFTQYAPLLTSGSAAVYVAGTQVAATANYDTGEITLTTPPQTGPVVASYTFTPYTSSQILQFLVAGFQEMEAVWYQRDWKLVDASGNAADENSANLYVADANGDDPVIRGSIVFSASAAQIGLLMACTELRYIRTIHNIKAASAYMWRETVRGMTVDQTKMPVNLLADVKSLEQMVERALTQAQNQYYGTGESYGGFIGEPTTLDYATNWDWQTVAKDQDWGNVIGYHLPLRPFG